MIKEFPDQDKRKTACKLRFTSKTDTRAEAFTMKDDPDFNLSAKELDMVAKAVGLKDQKTKAKKKR